MQEIKAELKCIPSSNRINLKWKSVIYENSLFKDVLDTSGKKKSVNFSKKMPLVLVQYDDLMQEFWSEILSYTGRQTK